LDTDNGGLQSSDLCVVNISWINEPPVADAGPDQTVEAEEIVTLDGSSSADFDDGIASFQWTQTAGTSITFDNPSAAQTFFTAPNGPSDGEDLALELTVTDNGGLKSTDSCAVTVTESSGGPDLTGSWDSLKRSRIWYWRMIRGNFKVENLGTQDAEPSSTYFYLSKDETLDGTDIQVGNKSVGALEAGQAVDISFRAFYSKRETYTYVIAEIDHGNAISETDENNNIIVSWPV